MKISTTIRRRAHHLSNGLRWAVVVVMLLGATTLMAQEDQKVTISPEARAYFEAMATKKDTAAQALIYKWQRDRFYKRFSIHSNLLDWATLVPNIGIEMDLKGTTRTNWSLLLTGKFNGSNPHGHLRYDVAQVRLEGRHYWRTGKQGMRRYHDEYVKLYTNPKDTLHYNGDSLSSKFYNFYQRLRRNTISGRTLDNARNWRAYYVGAWAGYDNWDIAARYKGNDGQGIAAGFLAGYTIPLLPQRYPKEGSLDLDLGALIGVKVAKYNGYTLEEDPAANALARVENPAKTTTKWDIVHYPILHDIHVSLVWRFRGIKSKVDRSLIDDYERKIEKFQARADKRKSNQDSLITARKHAADSLVARNAFVADSTSYWNMFHERRLKNALLINPDTVFTGEDLNLHTKILKGIEPTKKNLEKLTKAAAKQAKQEAEEQKKAAKQAADEQKKAAKKEADDLKKAADEQKKTAKKEADEQKKAAKKEADEQKKKQKEAAKAGKEQKDEE